MDASLDWLCSSTPKSVLLSRWSPINHHPLQGYTNPFSPFLFSTVVFMSLPFTDFGLWLDPLWSCLICISVNSSPSRYPFCVANFSQIDQQTFYFFSMFRLGILAELGRPILLPHVALTWFIWWCSAESWSGLTCPRWLHLYPWSIGRVKWKTGLRWTLPLYHVVSGHFHLVFPVG